MPNAVDREFVRLTIPHHRQGVQMAELAIERASSDDVKEMAQHTRNDQRQETAKLEGLLATVGLSPDDATPDETMAAGMQQMLEYLGQQQGHMFDASFLAMMMNHHIGAIHMAEVEAAGGQHDELVSMARSTHGKQMKELEQMREMLATESGRGMMNKVTRAMS